MCSISILPYKAKRSESFNGSLQMCIRDRHWLEWVITRPVEALQKRIETVGSGNFAPDRTVE